MTRPTTFANAVLQLLQDLRMLNPGTDPDTLAVFSKVLGKLLLMEKLHIPIVYHAPHKEQPADASGSTEGY